MATFYPYPSRLLDLKSDQDVLTALKMLGFQAHVSVQQGSWISVTGTPLMTI